MREFMLNRKINWMSCGVVCDNPREANHVWVCYHQYKAEGKPWSNEVAVEKLLEYRRLIPKDYYHRGRKIFTCDHSKMSLSFPK